ncbi:unnamed protein product [Sphagnum tenellum]
MTEEPFQSPFVCSYPATKISYPGGYGSTLLATPNSVLLSKSLEAWHDARGGTKSDSQMKVKEALELGSPILTLQAPPMLKAAEPMPVLRPNVGTIYSEDAGQYSTLKLMGSVCCEQG